MNAVDIQDLWSVLTTLYTQIDAVLLNGEEEVFQEFVRLFWSIVVTLFLGKRQRGGMGGFAPVEQALWPAMMQLEILPEAVVKCVDKNGNDLFASDAIAYCCKRVEHYIHVGFELLVKAGFVEKKADCMLVVKEDDEDGQEPELRLFDAIDDHKRMMQLSLYWCCLLYTSPSPRDLSTSRMPSSA